MCKSSQLRGMIKSASNDSDLIKHFPNWPLFALEFLSSCMKMDPHERLSSEELLRCNFFTHDRFPQRFLPSLREKVNTEFNTNPLLRKYKTEILMSTDKKDEVKPVRKISQPSDGVRWKFNNVTEGSMKRKYSYDMFGSENEKNLISLTKTSQRLSVVNQQKSGQNLLGLRQKDKKNTAEMEMLEKSLESLAKFTQKDTRPVSSATQKQDVLLPPASPLQFQSLQPGFGDFTNKSPNILHPSINNISFNLKKSPNLQQNVKPSTYNQVPLLNTSSKSQFLKKFERNVVVDTFGTNEGNSSSSWLSGYTSNVHNKQKKENKFFKSDVFTLPNLPGGILLWDV